MAKILVVDDELSMRQFLEILLKKEGHEVTCAVEGQEGLSRFQANSYDLLISDIKMPKMDGLELLRKVKEHQPDAVMIMITAYASPEDAIAAMKAGAYDYLTKPFKLREIKAVIRHALAKVATRESQEAPAGIFYDLVGHSPGMLKIYDLIKQVGGTKTNVLISGESGTGKELVARAIHQLSPRASQPFVTINCSAIPDSLMESELFGHAKGAFTGAVAHKKGLFEIAHGGTVFLDEIGDLSSFIQVKLLRVIQEREFIPVGDTKTVSVDVRLVSATNKDLEQEIIQGRFREDLYFRLNVVPLHLPPLRERREDIPLLAQYFLEKYSQELEKDVRSISSYALNTLMEYNFPGNIRELENIIERSVAMENSNIILPESLVLSEFKKEGKKKELPSIQITPAGLDLEKELGELEKDLILQALHLSNGVIKKAAELLNLSFRAMRWKIQKYNLRGFLGQTKE
ncbi:MAG: sigma-54-dependent Fis family transcriptional regulator [Deltaproteobacteria bacterium]|nr:sigma-54-dependent Fis family transcriptional regulator [Deltaproteobacteria bacterium]